MSAPSVDLSAGFPRQTPVASRFLSKIKSPPPKGPHLKMATLKDGRVKAFTKKGIFGKYAQFFKSQQSLGLPDAVQSSEGGTPLDGRAATATGQLRAGPLRGPPPKVPPSEANLNASVSRQTLAVKAEPQANRRGESAAEVHPKTNGIPHKALMAATFSQILSLKSRSSSIGVADDVTVSSTGAAIQAAGKAETPDASLTWSAADTHERAISAAESGNALPNDLQKPGIPSGEGGTELPAGGPGTTADVSMSLDGPRAPRPASLEAVTSAPNSSLDSRSVMTSTDAVGSTGPATANDGRHPSHASHASRTIAAESAERVRSSNEATRFERQASKSPASASAYRTVPLLVPIDPPLGAEDRHRASPLARGQSLCTTPVIKMCRNSRGEVLVERSPGDGFTLQGAWPSEEEGRGKQDNEDSANPPEARRTQHNQGGGPLSAPPEEAKSEEQVLNRQQANRAGSVGGPATPLLQKQVTRLVQECVDGFTLSVASESARSSASVISQEGNQANAVEAVAPGAESTVAWQSDAGQPSGGAARTRSGLEAQAASVGGCVQGSSAGAVKDGNPALGNNVEPQVASASPSFHRDEVGVYAEAPEGLAPTSIEATDREVIRGRNEPVADQNSTAHPAGPSNLPETQPEPLTFTENLDEPTVSGPTSSVSSMDGTVASLSKRTLKEDASKVAPAGSLDISTGVADAAQEPVLSGGSATTFDPSENAQHIKGKENQGNLLRPTDAKKGTASTEVVSIDLSSGVCRQGQPSKTSVAGGRSEGQVAPKKGFQRRAKLKKLGVGSGPTTEPVQGKDPVGGSSEKASSSTHMDPPPTQFKITAGPTVLGSPVGSPMAAASPHFSEVPTQPPAVTYYRPEISQERASPLASTRGLQTPFVASPVSYERRSGSHLDIQVANRAANSGSTQSQSRSSAASRVLETPKNRRHTTALDAEEIAEFDKHHPAGLVQQPGNPALESFQTAQQSLSRAPTSTQSSASPGQQAPSQVVASPSSKKATNPSPDTSFAQLIANVAPVAAPVEGCVRADPVEGTAALLDSPVAPMLDLTKAIAYRMPDLAGDPTWRRYRESPLKGGPVSSIQCLVTNRRTARRGRPVTELSRWRNGSVTPPPSASRSASSPETVASNGSRSLSCSAIERIATRRARIASTWRGTPIVNETRVIYHNDKCAKDARQPGPHTKGYDAPHSSAKPKGRNENEDRKRPTRPQDEKPQRRDRGVVSPPRHGRRSARRRPNSSRQKAKGREPRGSDQRALTQRDFSDRHSTATQPAFCPPLC